MFSTIISFNTVIDLGFSVTFIRFIAYAMGRYNGGTSLGDPTKNQYEISNQKHLQRVVGTLRVLFRRLTIFVFFLLLIGGTWFLVKPIEYLASPVEGFTSWAIVLLGTVISFKGNTYTVYLQGINRIAEFRRFETIFSLLSIFSSILVLIYGANLVVLILLNQFWVSISVIVNRWLCIKYNEGGFGKNEITVLDYKNIG